MFLVFVFVFVGWIASVCLHEFGHAIVAYWGGDTTVKDKGYLTLNPFKYTHPVLSFVLPLLFLLMGGIGLPGGAVYVDERRLRSRLWVSAVAAAGPAMTALVALAVAAPFWFGFGSEPNSNPLAAALAFLALLEVTALMLNLLPIPPLDGYRIISPWLSSDIKEKADMFAMWGMLLVFFVLFRIDAIANVFWGVTFGLTDALGIPRGLGRDGYQLFKFWER